MISLNQIPNVSPNLQIAVYLKDKSGLPYIFFNDVEVHEFPPKATITRCDLSHRFFCIDATLLC